MNYTIEQKRDALSRGELWWRFPHGAASTEREWGLVSEDLIAPIPDDVLMIARAEYFIGQTAPALLSEIERELVEVLELAIECVHLPSVSIASRDVIKRARAVISKLKG